MDCELNFVEFLESSAGKNLLVRILLDSQTQGYMFGEEELIYILDKLTFEIRENNPLYLRWTDEINGKKRQLSVPKKPLKIFTKNYLLNFIKTKKIHKGCHGGEPEWSAKKSLGIHFPLGSALSFDLEKAFENIPFGRVYGFFYDILNDNLNNTEREEIASFFSTICTVNYSGKRGLPLGSPFGVALFNRVLAPLDKVLFEKSRERGFRYSRWIDDFTISSKEKRGIDDFLGSAELTSKQFSISRDKVFFQENPAYLLGHKINNVGVFKNTKEEKLAKKVPPLDFDSFFGENRTISYEKW